MLLYASNRRLEGWGSLDVGGPVELVRWRSVSSLETAPMWVSPTQYLAGLSSAGYQTPQDFLLQGLILRRTLFCGISDATGDCSSGYQVLRNKCLLYKGLVHVLWGLIPRRSLFRGVSDPMGSCTAGPDTYRNFFLREIRLS